MADPQGRPIIIGRVQRGDILVALDTAGYAMVNNQAAPWTVIAQALEDFDGERGLVKTMIRKM